MPLIKSFTFHREVNVEYHPTAIWKFILLSIITLTLYQYYWFYRCWKYVKDEEESNILPFWRAFFSRIWFYPLFIRIYDGQKAWLGWILFILYFSGVFFGNADNFLVFIPLFDFIYTIPMVIKINSLGSNKQSNTYNRFGFFHIFSSIIILTSVVFLLT